MIWHVEQKLNVSKKDSSIHESPFEILVFQLLCLLLLILEYTGGESAELKRDEGTWPAYI